MSTEYKQYTLAEVAAHNSNKTTWFVIHNNIYDVTEFLNEVWTGRSAQKVRSILKSVVNWSMKIVIQHLGGIKHTNTHAVTTHTYAKTRIVVVLPALCHDKSVRNVRPRRRL